MKFDRRSTSRALRAFRAFLDAFEKGMCCFCGKRGGRLIACRRCWTLKEARSAADLVQGAAREALR